MKRYLSAILALLLLIVLAGCEEDTPPTPTGPSNEAPVIDSITASETSVQSGHPVTLIAHASDEDGDSLTFSWLTQTGGFLGRQTDTLAIWTPPYSAVVARIHLIVGDGTTTVRDSIDITVTGLDDRIPRNPYPLDGASDIEPYVTLAWEVADGVTEPLTYDVYLTSGQNLVRVAEGISETEWQVEGALQPGVEYRWRIAARPTSGEEILSQIYTFAVRGFEYGPPLGEIAFKNLHNFIGTWASDGITYLRRVGSESFIRNPSRVIAWNPGYDNASDPAMALYDKDTGSLHLVGEDGQSRLELSDVLPSLFSFSNAGSRIAYATPGDGSLVELYTHAVPPITGSSFYGRIDAPWTFSSRPALSVTNNSIAIAVSNTAIPNTGRLMVFANGGDDILRTREKLVWSPQFDPTGAHSAWLEANDDGPNASHLFIGSGTFIAQDSISIEEYGSNATSFSWSPDGSKIAMFSRIFSGTPSLLVYDLNTETMSELSLPNPIVLPTENRQDTRPSWNSDSSEFTVCVQNGEVYLLLAVTPTGGSRVLIGGDEISEPIYAVWR